VLSRVLGFDLEPRAATPEAWTWLTGQMESVNRSRSSAPLSVVAVVVGYAVAITAFTLRVGLGDLPWQLELPGGFALGAVAALPPTLALIGLSGRPVSLLAAGVTALSSLPVLSLLGVVMAMLGAYWVVSSVKLELGGALRAVAITSAVWLLWASSVAMLFVHLDPRCAQTRVDGTVVVEAPTGLYSGWVWNAPPTAGSSSSSDQSIVTETCASDVITWIEAVVILASTGAAAGIGSLATRDRASTPTR
jgi:hypothetical protein